MIVFESWAKSSLYPIPENAEIFEKTDPSLRDSRVEESTSDFGLGFEDSDSSYLKVFGDTFNSAVISETFSTTRVSHALRDWMLLMSLTICTLGAFLKLVL